MDAVRKVAPMGIEAAHPYPQLTERKKGWRGGWFRRPARFRTRSEQDAVLEALVPAPILTRVCGWGGAPRTWSMPCAI